MHYVEFISAAIGLVVMVVIVWGAAPNWRERPLELVTSSIVLMGFASTIWRLCNV